MGGKVHQQEEAAGGHCCGQYRWSKEEDLVGSPAHTCAQKHTNTCALQRGHMQ